MSQHKLAKLREAAERWRSRMRTVGSRTRRFHSDKSARLTAEAVGFGLAVGGGLLAVAGLVGILFVPATTFTTLDGELFLLFGIILLVVGIIVDKAE